jgi:hypothetical protein
VLNDPLLNVNVERELFKALPSVQPHPTPLTVVAEARVTPLVVNVLPVLEPDSVIAPV